MADGSGARLPKVIVLLALLTRIGCDGDPARWQRDDLLDRVRLSKSNEPEVREFLNSVLRHHADFRWIRREANKVEHSDIGSVVGRRGAAQKIKRSFYAGEDPDADVGADAGAGDGQDRAEALNGYVYDDDTDERKGNEGDLQSFASNSNLNTAAAEGSRRTNVKLQQGDALKDDLDFDGPVNDIYPYREHEELSVPQQDRRFVRETQDSFLYDEQRRFDDDDLLTAEGGAPELGLDSGGRSGEEDEVELAAEAISSAHDRSKRAPAACTEHLLDEKILLHRMLSKPLNITNEDIGEPIKARGFHLDSLAYHLPGDAIQVIPASQKGVRYAPGTKLEQDHYNQEDLEALINREDPTNNPTGPRVGKRKCSDASMENDFKVPNLFEGNKSKAEDIDGPQAEFYYSHPHDVIGLNQDVRSDVYAVTNTSCTKNRRDMAKKSIQIKIIDNDDIVRDIGRSPKGNSVVLTIENDQDSKEAVAKGPMNVDAVKLMQPKSDASTVDNEPRKYLLKSATNAKDDRIIQNPHPEKYATRPLIVPPTHASAEVLEDDHPDDGDDNHNHLAKDQSYKQYNRKYNRINEMGTAVSPKASAQDREFPRMLNQFPHAYQQEQQANKFKNQLEDQTEPTSAAEQRVLGRVNTEPMDRHTSTDKVIVIPFRQAAKHHAQSPMEPSEFDGQETGQNLMLASKLEESANLVDKLKSDVASLKTRLQMDLPGLEDNDEADYDEEKRKRFTNADLYLHGDQLKADAFRSRKLFAWNDLSDDPEKDDGDDAQLSSSTGADPSDVESNIAEDRDKKDIRTALGMRNDQDYSEDKVDVYMADNKSKKGNKPSALKKNMEAKIRQRLLGSFVNTQQEQQSLKAHRAKTKSNKVKKHVDGVEHQLEEDDVLDADLDQDQLDVLKETGDSRDHDEEDDDANLLIRGVPVKSKHVKGQPEEMLLGLPVLRNNIDRCCENAKTTPAYEVGNDSGKGYGGDNGNDSASSNGVSPFFAFNGLPQESEIGKGNELDIIEKSQAILFHIKGQGSQSDPVNQMDDKRAQENVEVKAAKDTKGVKDVKGVKEAKDVINVKTLDPYQVHADPDKMPQSVVSEIIKMVENYKNKVNEYNKSQKQEKQDKDDGTKEEVIARIQNNRKQRPPMTTPAKEIDVDHIPDIQQDRKELQKQRNEERAQTKSHGWSTTIVTESTPAMFTLEDINKVLVPEKQEGVAIHAHAAQHLKKLHPIKSNKCESGEKAKSEKDKDADFIQPQPVREAYIKPEVVADNDPSEAVNNDNAPLLAAEEVTNARKDVDALGEMEDRRRSPEKVGSQLGVTPFNFNADPTDNFREIVDSNRELVPAFNQNHFESEVFEETDSADHDLRKRNLARDYTDEEIDKLMEMVDGSSRRVRQDAELQRRYRRYKNFEPYYESLPRFRHSRASAPPPDQHPTSTELMRTNAPKMPPCADVEKDADNGQPLISHHKEHKKKTSCHEDEEEFGDTCKLHAGSKKKSKGAQEKEKKDRAHIRDRIYEEKDDEKRKEQEHIKNVLNGHLVIIIMDKFHKKVKENERLNNRFGSSMGKKCACEEVDVLDRFKDEQNKFDVHHAQLMLHQVIVLMNKIVAEQVHRRTCLLLSPQLKDFLKRTAGKKDSKPKTSIIAEGYPLPPVTGDKNKEIVLDESQADFLFTDSDEEEQTSLSSMDEALRMRKKINLIKQLLAKYDHMTHTCQVKVEPVHDYLVQHMKTLHDLYHRKQWGEQPDACAVSCAKSEMSTPAVRTAPPSAGAKMSGARSLAAGETLTTMGLGDAGAAVATQPATNSGGAPQPRGVDLREAPTSDDFALTPDMPLSSPQPGDAEVANTPKARSALYDSPAYGKPHAGRLFRNYGDDATDLPGDSREGNYPSDKYRRLMEAAANYRRKRQIEERLARLFGRSRATAMEYFETTPIVDEDLEVDLSNAAFEAPVVLSLH